MKLLNAKLVLPVYVLGKATRIM